MADKLLPEIQDWINTKKVIAKDAERPCEDLEYCPYSQSLIKAYPSHGKDSKYACPEYGNDCPVFYMMSELGVRES